MSSIIFTFLTFLSFFSSMSNPSPDQLKKDIQAEFGKTGGTFALAFKDMQTGEQVLINEKVNFHAASTMKTPVMIEVYKQEAAGKFGLNDPIEVKNRFKSIVDSSEYSLNEADDSDSSLYRMIGKKLPIYDLMYLMIIRSSNLATNMIIDLVGAANANKTMREMGANDIQVRRGVEDSKAFQKGLNNTTTAYDQMVIFEAMAQRTAVSRNASEAMIKILLDQAFNDKIPALLPKDVRVAHKTGWIKGVNHDAGIVFLPDGRRYVLVLLSKDLTDDQAAVQTMAKVSKLVYDHMMKK